MTSFKDTGLRGEILDAVRELGFEQPTPIQAKAIPQLLSSNQDLIAFAQTGTGKTAAFGLPVVHLTDTDNNGAQTLILCPTRELCLQITKDLKRFSKNRKGLGVVPVYGGAKISTQIKALRGNAQIVVGTPGRVKDLINRKKLVLSGVNRVVLDEADEMLTMGFKDDLDAILAETPKEKQTLLFSATMSREVMGISKKYMKDPVQLSVAPQNAGAENVEHIYYTVHAKDKYEVLKRLADMHPDFYGIVFCRTRRDTKEIAAKLGHDGYDADAIHGDLSQGQRDEVMGRFRNRQLQILVATDVAARGLDVKDLTHVINFSLPDDAESYIHRSGRTGRAGKSGVSIAITHMRENRKIRDIERKGGISFTKAEVPSGKEICEKQLFALIDKIKKVEVDDRQIEPFLPAIYDKLQGLSREELIQHFVSAEFNRFLDYYRDAKDINVGNRKKQKRERKERGQTTFSNLFINVGTKQNLHPARLIGMINEALDSSEAEIGKIDIKKKFSFFEIEQQAERQLIEALNGQHFGGVPLAVEVSQGHPGAATAAKERKAKAKKKPFKKKNRRQADKGRRRSRSKE